MTYGLKSLLSQEEESLSSIIKITEKRLASVPEGSLRCTSHKGKASFYHRLNSKDSPKCGTYISRKNSDLISALAQKGYDIKVLKLAKKRLSQIRRITEDYSDDEIECLYLQGNRYIKKYIQPVVLPWEVMVDDWLSVEYSGKGFPDNMAVILSDKGERVRSKSEKILADYFYHHEIPYKYECPLNLQGRGIVYPDFTFLSHKTGREIYWEHEGMMDDADYAKTAIKKIETYERNGIFPGEQLILTYETSVSGINTGIIEKLVEKYLI